MEPELHNTIRELTELAASLTGELEDVLLQKKASDMQVADLQKQLTALRKQAETFSQEKVILEKVASHGIACPALIPVLGKLEKAGFIKEAMAAYDGIKRRPDHIINLLSLVADSFSDDFSEGAFEKLASNTTLPKDNNTTTVYDVSGWSRILTEGA